MGLANVVGDVTRTSIAKVHKVRSEGTHYPKVLDFPIVMKLLWSVVSCYVICYLLLCFVKLCYVYYRLVLIYIMLNYVLSVLW